MQASLSQAYNPFKLTHKAFPRQSRRCRSNDFCARAMVQPVKERGKSRSPRVLDRRDVFLNVALNTCSIPDQQDRRCLDTQDGGSHE